VAIRETVRIWGRSSAPDPNGLPILHAREARALSKINDHQRCYRALGAAFESLTTTCDHEPQWCYWINSTEIHMLAGSCALDLGDPRRALDHFTTAHTAFDTGNFPAARDLSRASR